MLLFLTQALSGRLVHSQFNMMGILELSSVNFQLCFDCVFCPNSESRKDVNNLASVCCGV